MSRTSTPAQYALILIDLVESRGCPRRQLLEGTSLARTGITGIGARIGDRDFALLANNALRLTGDSALGLELGMRLNLSAHALLGQAFMTCRDLGQVMELFLKYHHLLAPGIDLAFETTGDRCSLTVVTRFLETPAEFNYELLCAAILNTVRGLLGEPQLRLQVDLPYPAPPHSEQYRAIFGEDVRFGCARCRISFPRSLLSSPLPSSNPALRTLYERECARLLADLEEDVSVAERTLQLLRKLEGQYPKMPQIARMLNFSPRTYRRRLEAENHAYQELLDRVRAEHATRYLRNTRLPLSSVAYLVGFNDVSNFRRAYRRWTGQSPREARDGD